MSTTEEILAGIHFPIKWCINYQNTMQENNIIFKNCLFLQNRSTLYKFHFHLLLLRPPPLLGSSSGSEPECSCCLSHSFFNSCSILGVKIPCASNLSVSRPFPISESLESESKNNITCPFEKNSYNLLNNFASYYLSQIRLHLEQRKHQN